MESEPQLLNIGMAMEVMLPPTSSLKGWRDDERNTEEEEDKLPKIEKKNPLVVSRMKDLEINLGPIPSPPRQLRKTAERLGLRPSTLPPVKFCKLPPPYYPQLHWKKEIKTSQGKRKLP